MILSLFLRKEPCSGSNYGCRCRSLGFSLVEETFAVVMGVTGMKAWLPFGSFVGKLAGMSWLGGGSCWTVTGAALVAGAAGARVRRRLRSTNPEPAPTLNRVTVGAPTSVGGALAGC